MQAAVNNVEEFLATKDDNNWNLPVKAEMPLHTSYGLELYVSIELIPAESTHNMSLIGMMMCMVEFVQVDICLECSTMC